MKARLLGRLENRFFQFLRFCVVGVSNTAMDFAVTNLLVLITQIRSGYGLLIISATACLTATLNSYFWNRSWTFRDLDKNASRNAFFKFFAVALLSMVVNTSVFLFLFKYLPEFANLPEMLTLNLAKLGGVLAALMVSFLGYAFGVFQTQRLKEFRDSFFFQDVSTSFGLQASILIAVTVAVRLIYLSLTTAVSGDAVSYGWVALSLAKGDYHLVDSFWSSLFCYWQALFHFAGFGPKASVIASSLIPGIVLVVPVSWMARKLYGSTVAWLAGAFCALHPRLIEYSANGYAESFYVLAFALGTAFLVMLIDRPSKGWALAWGVSFGVFAGVRSEALIAFGLSMLLVFLARSTLLGRNLGCENPRVTISKRLAFFSASRLAVTGVLGFVLAAGAYAALSQVTLETPGVFQKTSNLSKQFSEQLDVHSAARETYGASGTLYGTSQGATSLSGRLGTLMRRIPSNLGYSLERLPGILLSPIPLFAFLLPVFVKKRSSVELPLLVMLFFPIVFYPMIQVEPRFFLPILIPLNIFGAAGLYATAVFLARRFQGSESAELEKPRQISSSSSWLCRPSSPSFLYGLAAVGVIGLSISISVWRGVTVEDRYSTHRQLAQWIELNVGENETIVGCGYGNISTTGFLTAHRTIPRLWTDQPEELTRFVDEKSARWLLLYEEFLKKANPELLPALDSGLPGFERVHEVIGNGARVQVFQRARNL
jgi:putative flippase GtrA